MATWRIRHLQPCDRDALTAMRAALWPKGSIEEHRREVDDFLAGQLKVTLPWTTLVAVNDDNAVIGFIEVDLRSHADGCDPAQPVGYVEGWFVREEFRNQGVGAELIRAAENWAREQGCIEMASDALIENEVSQRAHAALGFEVVDRCVNFRKRLW